MNIPPPGFSHTRQIWFRVWWALVAVFAPEVVLLRALFQWHTARNLRDRRNEILDQQQAIGRQGNMATTDHGKNEREYWTFEHGFFAVMGGFEVTVREVDQWILDDGRTVAPRGILELARLNKLPTVDRDIISGRGKADLLTKVLVVSQATWMLVQAIGRKAAGLPITLLELNTLAHVGCALLLYLIWWKKPQDVTEAIKIELGPRLATYMSSRRLRTTFQPVSLATVQVSVSSTSKYSNTQNIHTHPQPEQNGPQERALRGLLPKNISGRYLLGAADISAWQNSTETISTIRRKVRQDGLVMLLPGQWLEGIPITPVSCPQHLTPTDIDRLEVWNKLLHNPLYHNRNDTGVNGFSRDARLTQRASQGRIQGNLQEFSESKTLLIFATLGALYGGVHATSWAGHFPTGLERFLWQIAVSVVMVGGLCIYFLDCALRHWTRTFLWPLGKGSHSLSRTTVQKILSMVTMFIIKGIVVAFSLARAFLVVEAFISLRDPPVGTYRTADWSNWLPHFG